MGDEGFSKRATSKGKKKTEKKRQREREREREEKNLRSVLPEHCIYI